jgi:hypothetical protein
VWRENRNLVTQVQWWNDQPDQMRAWAAELIARSPDVAVTYTNLALAVLKPIAGNVPIVFVGVGDPNKMVSRRRPGTTSRKNSRRLPAYFPVVGPCYFPVVTGLSDVERGALTAGT